MAETGIVGSETGPDLTASEWVAYEAVVAEAKQALGIRHLGVITPIRSLPVSAEKDTGIGSLPAAEPFFEFITKLGFDVVQIDPEGKTKLSDPSPYAGTVFSTNPMLIDLEPLASDAWGNILSGDTLARIRKNNPNPHGHEVAYAYVYQAQDEALSEVYVNFKARRDALKDIADRFEAFASRNRLWLERDALYEALSLEYGNDYWPVWKGEHAKLDKNLFNDEPGITAEQKQNRIAALKEKYADVIGAYQFAQFIASEQKHAFKAFSQRHNFSVMADRQVGLSDRDVWAYQSLFLSDWALGAPPDFFSAYGQAWGFPVFDPEKLFKPDGNTSDFSLGEGGKLLSLLYEKIFEENPGGVRIDHIIGLIDPWVYPASAKSTRDGARLYSAPEHPELGKYAYVSEADLDPAVEPDKGGRVRQDALNDDVVSKYAAVMEKIVIPAAKKHGVGLELIICEDLGTLTNPVIAVMEKYGYSGIRVTQFVDPNDPAHMYRGKNTGTRHWITPGTHDNDPVLLWSARVLENSDTKWRHAENLTADLIANPDQYPEARDEFKHHLAHDALALTRAKFAELFASSSKQVQLFFTDLFGMETPYNRPSTVGNENWTLRIPREFKAAYFSGVKARKAFNLPDAMAMALRARGNDADGELIVRLEAVAGTLRQASER